MGKRNQHTFVKGHAVPKEWTEKIREKLKGRKLKEQACIHHINGNHNDNRPENRIIVTRSEHALIHQLQGDVGFQKGNTIGKEYWRKRKCP